MTIRLSIIEHSLQDIFERLVDVRDGTDARALRRRVELYQETVSGWNRMPPGEQERSDMLRRVLDLNVEVMRLGGSQTTRAPILDEEEEDGELPFAIPLRPRPKT